MDLQLFLAGYNDLESLKALREKIIKMRNSITSIDPENALIDFWDNFSAILFAIADKECYLLYGGIEPNFK